jgi:hypothetical protein
MILADAEAYRCVIQIPMGLETSLQHQLIPVFCECGDLITFLILPDSRRSMYMLAANPDFCISLSHGKESLHYEVSKAR